MANAVPGPTEGSDVINGTIGNDSLLGWGGDDRLLGIDGNDMLDGGLGNDTLDGGLGNDTLDGSSGNDSMEGGAGNDFYIVDSLGDVVVEDANSGQDTVVVRAGLDYELPENVENATLWAYGNLKLVGNALDNLLDGLSGDNTLLGLGGNDTLYGEQGNDWLDGGAGDDRMVGGAGDDTSIVDSTGDVVVEETDEGTDTVRASVNHTLSSNVENLVLTGGGNLEGYGNELDNTLTGNTGSNTLDGGAGNDRMVGGAGDDTYIVDSTGDAVVEETDEGTDTVRASVNHTLSSNVENLVLTGGGNLEGYGNELDNTLTGNAGDNSLYGDAGNDTTDGGAGDDRMVGGAGDDTYIVDSTGDAVVEETDEGTDTVRASVNFNMNELSHIENLVLTGNGNWSGIGNSLANLLSGNAGNNLLYGDAGDDTLFGGAGNDTLVGGAGRDSLDGGAGDDILYGYSYGDVHMAGGAGDDTYYVVSLNDEVVEASGQGTDTVQAKVSYILTDYVENLVLTAGFMNGTGNAGDNILDGSFGHNVLSGLGGSDTLNGGAGNDSLIGGAGNDLLSGGSGADRFVFNLQGNNANAVLGPAEYFDQWLKSNGLSLKKLTTVDVFNAKYESWLDYLVKKHQFGHDLNNDDTIRMLRLAGSSGSLPYVEGLTPAQIDDLFDAARSITFNGRTKPTVNYSNQFNAPPALTLTSQDGQDVITDFVRGEDKLVLEVSGTFYRDPRSAVTIETGQFFGGDGSGLDTRIGLTTDAFWSVVLSGVTGITASDIDWVFSP